MIKFFRFLSVPFIVLLISPLFYLFSFAAEPPRSPQARPHIQDEIIVRFREGVHEYNKALAHFGLAAKAKKVFKTLRGLELVKLPPGLSVKEAVKLYQQHPDVLYAEPNYIVKALVVPNDPSFGDLWGLHNIGQAGGTNDADTDAPEAWGITTGSSDVVVAVIDTGVDYNHQDLSENMFRNQADCNNNGVDDDGNGFVDDCYGVDTANDDSDPMDDHNHGTHVAGMIGAVGDNSVGVVGVNWDVSIMACKFLNASGSGSIGDAIDCLDYVKIMKDRGVNIVATSNSWGGGGFSQALFDAIDAHRQRGILFIAAAGNDSGDNDGEPHYPSNYDLPNVVSVAATTRNDALASFSNFGRRTVHLGAPGSAILSTTPGDTYSTFSGTSMATPHVAGVAALLKAQNSARDWKAIKNLLLAGGDTVASMTNTITQKRLNAHGAMTCSDFTVLSRLRPISDTITGSIGTPIDLAALHINCADPNGNVSVTVDPGGQMVTLMDDGLGIDQAEGDGIYSGQWTPSAGGTYTLTLPDGEVVTVEVLSNYSFAPTPFSWRTITGTNLNLDDDSSAQIASPFPILFGGGSFTDLFVSSNGNVNFTGPFTEYSHQPIPFSAISTLVAPFWDDLFPVAGDAQNVFWAVVGGPPNRELVIEWRDVRHFSCSSDSSATARFQVVFFESSSDILFNYADALFGGGCTLADGGGSASVGVQVASNRGTQFSFNTQSLNNNFALLWSLETGGDNDLTAPIAGLVTPSNTRYGNFVDSPFDLSTSFTDNESAVTSCEYTINGGSTWLPATISGSLPNFTCTKTGITGSNGQVLNLNMRATSGGGTSQGTAVQVRIDSAPPTGSVKINSGDAFTKSTAVQLTLTASDTSGLFQMCISNTNSACSTWENFSKSKNWNLSSDDGTKTVYVWFKDKVGNINPSPFSDQITLDTVPPTNPTTITSLSHTLSVWSKDRTVDMSWSGTADDRSGVYGYSITWDKLPTTLPDTTSDTTSTKKTSSSLLDGNSHYFHIRTGDKAGNWSSSAVHKGPFFIDGTPPVNGTLAATPGNSQVSLSWSGFSDVLSGLAATKTYRLVFKTTTYPSSSCTNGNQIFLGTGTSFTHTGLTNGTTYYYRLCAFDNAGNVSTGFTRSAIPQ